MKKLFALVAAAAAAVVVTPAPATVVTAPGKVKLTISHVQRGCHSWYLGGKFSTSASVKLRVGGQLVVVNQDLDMHRLVQTAGSKVRIAGATMMMSHAARVAFPKAGVYRFKTKVSEMPGMDEVKTMGPDHKLVLTVRVG